MPRAFSSGALSISSNGVYGFRSGNWSCRTLVMAAVSVVLPWSMWPIVPMLQCGLVRSNFALPTVGLLQDWCYCDVGRQPGLFAASLLHDLFCHIARHFGVRVELHRVVRAPLRLAAE